MPITGVDDYSEETRQ